ncbi:MAG: Dyp-type peroxidase [Proteobacteria bacterium]|nr:Dyp-type peroxidase [Pseudomonadota bacterium]
MTTNLPQAIVAPLTSAAIFLVVDLKHVAETRDIVQGLCGDLSALVRSIRFRDQGSQLSCVAGFGSDAWDRIFGGPHPPELHPFREIKGAKHQAVSTQGDLLFHIRAMRMDMCFELAMLINQRLASVTASVDEVHGFRYFDERDLLGFVDGTENPVDQEALASAVIADSVPDFAGGSYVIVQKYLHDLKAWNAQSVEAQEDVIGRSKLTDIEQTAAVKKSYAHNELTSIEENGVQLKIVRDNMPFGDSARGVFGTYFIGYACSPARTEKMLENMFIGNPPGNYDRLLDVSRAVTGSLFFCPTATFLDNCPGTM